MKTNLPEPKEPNRTEPSLDQRFAPHPELRARLFAIADLIEQSVAEGCTADEAEARAIPLVRQVGQGVLAAWAAQAEPAARRQAQAENPALIACGKKKP